MNQPVYKHDKLLRGVLRLAVALMPPDGMPRPAKASKTKGHVPNDETIEVLREIEATKPTKRKPKKKPKAKPAPAPPPQPQPETAA